MKVFVLLFTILICFHSGSACTVSIYDIKAKSIFGKVVDAYKNVIPNAIIQIYRNKDEGEEILAETKTDVNGIFEITDFKPGKYMIRANAEHFTFSYASLKLKKSSSKKRAEEIVVTLVPFFECSGAVEMKKISSE